MAWRPSAKAVRTSPAVRPATSVPRRAARTATSGGVWLFIQSLTRRWTQTELVAPTPIPITIHRSRFSTPPSCLLGAVPAPGLRPAPQAASHPAHAVADGQDLHHRVGE